MRTKQKHICWGCGKNVETFVKKKRKVYFVKIYQCDPKCFMCLDIERVENKITSIMSSPSPWVGMLYKSENIPDLSTTIRKVE